MADQTALTAAQVKQINFTDNVRNSYKVGNRLSDIRFRQHDANNTGIFKSSTTAKGNIANISLTVAECLSGVVTFDTNNGNRTITVPIAAAIVSGISAIDDQHTCEVGDSFYLYLVNEETGNFSRLLPILGVRLLAVRLPLNFKPTALARITAVAGVGLLLLRLSLPRLSRLYVFNRAKKPTGKKQGG